MKTVEAQNNLKDLGIQYDQMLFDKKERKKKEDFFSSMNRPASLNQIFDRLKETKKRQMIRILFIFIRKKA